MRTLSLLLAASLPLLAQAPTPATGDRPMARHLAQALDLSPEQQTKMKSIREKHATALKAGHDAARSQSEAFRAAMEDPKTGDAQLRQAFDQMNAARFQAILEGRAMHQEMRAVLTPEQQAKADAMRAEFRERAHARMERHIKDMPERPDADQ